MKTELDRAVERLSRLPEPTTESVTRKELLEMLKLLVELQLTYRNTLPQIALLKKAMAVIALAEGREVPQWLVK